MSTTPDTPIPDRDYKERDPGFRDKEGAPGAEVGMSEGEGSTFEPEEDPEGHR